MSQPSNKPANQPKGYIQQTHIKGEIFQSSYPPPEMLENYAQIDSSIPQQLIDMAKSEGRHRRWSEKFIITGAFILDILGLVAAVAAIAGILYVGWLFMEKGNSTDGRWIIVSISAAVVVAFLTRGRKNHQTKK